MTTLLSIDPLFIRPIATGLLAAFILPLLGILLHVRREWLAALGIAHMSVAAQITTLLMSWGIIATTAVSTLICVVIRWLLSSQGNIGYGLMILLGWSAIYTVAANTALADQLAHAINDGQLLLVNREQSYLMLVCSILTLLLLIVKIPALLRHELTPLELKLNRQSDTFLQIIFYSLCALAITAAVYCMGVMVTFALLFITPLIGFQFSRSFRQCLWFCPILGMLIYLITILFAIHFDQPIGSLLTLVLVIILLITRGLRWIISAFI